MRYSEEEKAMWLEDWKASGKSAWAYAKENGLNQQTFINWTKAGGEAKQTFVEVAAVSSADTASSINAAVVKQSLDIPEIIIEKGEVKIYIPVMINQNQLRAIMEGLGATL